MFIISARVYYFLRMFIITCIFAHVYYNATPYYKGTLRKLPQRQGILV